MHLIDFYLGKALACVAIAWADFYFLLFVLKRTHKYEMPQQKRSKIDGFFTNIILALLLIGAARGFHILILRGQAIQ